jgi:hypothetical protein
VKAQTQAFIDRFGPTADKVAAGTGINRWALLVQWAVETAIGSAVFGNNPGNIRCGPSTFCNFATLDDFAAAAVATWHSTAPPPLEPWRAQAAGKAMRDQLLAIGGSPWDAGRYGLAACGYAGCSLIQMWLTEFDGIGDFKTGGATVVATTNSINLLMRGIDKALYTRRFDGTSWGPWRSLGGILGLPTITAFRRQDGSIHALVVGSDGVTIWETVSTDDGVSWTGLGPFGGQGDGLVAVGAGPATPSALTPQQSAELAHIESMLLNGLKGT